MIKRIWIYLKEMHPPLSRLFVSLILFLELYFIVMFNSGVMKFSLGIQEVIGILTIFSFLLLLRVADDFKDYEIDQTLSPQDKRPLPSGRVKKTDLIVLLAVVEIPIIIANLVFMNNVPFFLFLYIYGFLMSMWFFQKAKIQKNLVLACITHNPIQMIINVYIISFVCIKYGIAWASLTVIMAAFTMYFPGLIWEVARKIRAPKEENNYVTYSKIFGYKKATIFITVLMALDVITNFILVWNLNKIAIVILALNLLWMIIDIMRFIKNPNKFTIISKVLRYTYIQEFIMLATVFMFMLIGKI